MSTKVVVMAAIPGRVQRGAIVRSDLEYARYGQATWSWWCNKRGIRFVVLNEPPSAQAYTGLPPTIQRWLAPAVLFEEYGPDSQVAVIDADTMIRWDAPDFFDIAGKGFAAVRASVPAWIYRSIRAHQHLFPGVSLPWWEYFNSGVVVLRQEHLTAINAFTSLALERWPELQAVQASGDFGTDQTPLNFMVRKHGIEVCLMPPPFNLIHCVPPSTDLWQFEKNAGTDNDALARKLSCQQHLFDFVDFGYIWHFSNVLHARQVVMAETWRRVAANYPGVSIAGHSPLPSTD